MGKTKRDNYTFKGENTELEEIVAGSSDPKKHPLEYYNILTSKNKDFG